VQCRLSGQTLFLRSTGSKEWEWSPLRSQLQAIAELPHTCTVPGAGRSVLQTEREVDVSVDPCDRARLGRARC
jgi:hypothetical protein